MRLVQTDGLVLLLIQCKAIRLQDLAGTFFFGVSCTVGLLSADSDDALTRIG